MLELSDVDAGYGDILALHGISLTLEAGEIVAVVGANGAGKTAMLRAISGLVAVRAGQSRFEGERLDHLAPHEIVERGVVQVAEGRKIFPALSVQDNLDLGAYPRAARPWRRRSLDGVFALFPRLAERARQPAGTMSGGEQQMLAIGRAPMARPRLLMLDEPSLGLAPRVIAEIFSAMGDINRIGTTLMLVEQNTRQALALARRGYVLESGRVALAGTGAALIGDPHVQRAYLGL